MKDMTKSAILAVLACLGVGATGYLSYQAGKSTEKGKKKFVLPVLAGAATCGLMIASNRISAGAYAGLAATAGYLAQHRDELRKGTPKENSDWSFLKLPKSAEETGNGNVLCFEAYSGRWFYSDPDAVDDAIVVFNHTYENNGYYAGLNDLYEALDIEVTHFGDQYGWVGSQDGYNPNYINWISDYVDIDGVIVYVIEPASSYDYPMEGWQEI